jgi:hypothetical protein
MIRGALRARGIAAALVGVLALAGCSSSSGDAANVDAAATDGSPGRLLAEPVEFPGYPALADLTGTSVSVRYASTSGIDGSPTEVTGVVFAPKGTPPEGGWPIASIGHATTGVNSRCAPSTRIGLLGSLTTIIPFLSNGYAVTMTDYQGLGTSEVHPYLEPTTAGYNSIDAVRAAREVLPESSTDWVGYGVSQGGQAVWSANELSDDYGEGLRLLGTVSMSPATDLTGLVDEMQNGTLTTAQIAALPSILTGIAAKHPELETSDYLHGVLERRSDAFLTCVGENSALQSTLADSVVPADYAPVSPQAADRLRTWLAEYSIPKGPAPQPMFVGYGDQDQLVAPQWTIDAVRRGCAMGDVIELQVAANQGHGILNLGALPAQWLDGRAAGTPPPNNCGG